MKELTKSKPTHKIHPSINSTQFCKSNFISPQFSGGKHFPKMRRCFPRENSGEKKLPSQNFTAAYDFCQETVPIWDFQDEYPNNKRGLMMGRYAHWRATWRSLLCLEVDNYRCSKRVGGFIAQHIGSIEKPAGHAAPATRLNSRCSMRPYNVYTQQYECSLSHIRHLPAISINTAARLIR